MAAFNRAGKPGGYKAGRQWNSELGILKENIGVFILDRYAAG
jgi:hypothetical protein